MASESASDMELQIPPPATAVEEEEPARSAQRAFKICSENVLMFIICGVPAFMLLVFIFPFLVAAMVGVTLLSPLGMMLLFSFHKNTADLGVRAPMPLSSSSSSSMVGIYDRSRSKDTFSQRAMFSSLSLLARSGLLLLLWLVLTLSISVLKKSTILGSPLWKWSLLAAVLVSAYFVAIAIYLLPGAIQTTAIKLSTIFSFDNFVSKSKIRYYHPYLNLHSHMFPNLTLVIYFAMVLVTWIVYFRADQGLGQSLSPRATEYLTWTWVSLLVGSILLLLKTILVLKWSSGAIYRRFEPRILITGVKFVYLSLAIGGYFDDQIVSKLNLIELFEIYHYNRSSSFTNAIMSQKLDITYLQDVGSNLAFLATNVAPLEEDGVPCVVRFFENKITETYQRCRWSDLYDIFGPGNYDHYMPAGALDRIVTEECGSDEFTFDDLKKWMVDAHKNCVNMGKSLNDASAMVTRLDLFISFVISIVVVLLWLLITGVATTTVLVTIATPFLALTFIFGDTAKTFFQGIIFCFATHAYDVGDRCIVDETEFEVKSIDILTTVFLKIGTTEKMMYPNSLLATKAILNLGWQPDPTDVVELTLDFSTSPMELQKLETKLQQFFSDPQQRRLFERLHEVMIEEIGDKIKVTIHYTHVLNIKEMTHGECARKKKRQRSVLLKKVYHFLDHGGVSSNYQVLPELDPVNLLKRRKSWS